MIIFKNGDRFQGTLDTSNEVLTGVGVLTFADGTTYKGNIING